MDGMEINILREISQAPKDKCHIISLMWKLKTKVDLMELEWRMTVNRSWEGGLGKMREAG